MISGTITDRSGRLLSGQTPEAFWNSVRHAAPFSIGLNCALGAKEMRAHIAELARIADTLVCAYPNAGLPNEFGRYDESPASMAALLGEFAAAGLVNIVGGCCGTTPDHIRAIAARRRGQDAPRQFPAVAPLLRLSGLEAFTLTPEIPFVNVGERTNVTGSARFRKLITAGDYAAALAVARDQVENGAQIIDVNMDEGLLDSEKAMTTFLNLIAAEPDIARVPVMVDSSKFSVIEAGLKCVQGKAVVNSISHEGRRGGVHPPRQDRAPLRRRGRGHGVRRAGPGRHPRAQDVRSRSAPTTSWSTASAFRPRTSSSIRTSSPSPPAWRSTTATASPSSRRARWIRQNLPHAHVSGGVSNLSFSFRGNEPVREAMHSVFLYHAIEAGMDMGIVNAGQMAVYDDLDRRIARGLRGRGAQPPRRMRPSGCWRSPQRYRGHGKEKKEADLAWREWPVEKRLSHALVHGITDFIEADVEEARRNAPTPARRDRGPADGRHERGRRPVRLGRACSCRRW